MKKTAVITGTFDPITNGHMDLVLRCHAVFERVVLLVCQNGEKHCFFSAEERLAMATDALQGLPGVRAELATGLVADFLRSEDGVLVRGVRSGSDADYEIPMAQINRKLCGADTLLLPVRPEFMHLSSTYIRDMIRHGIDISDEVPRSVVLTLASRGR